MRKLISFLLLIYSCALGRLVLSTQWLYKIKETRKTLISRRPNFPAWKSGWILTVSRQLLLHRWTLIHAVLFPIIDETPCPHACSEGLWLGLSVSQHCIRWDRLTQAVWLFVTVFFGGGVDLLVCFCRLTWQYVYIQDQRQYNNLLFRRFTSSVESWTVLTERF